jgi:hypothetical protein
MNIAEACRILSIDNLDSGMTKKELHQIYRKYALKYHPDKCKLDDAHARFIEIQNAYQFLLHYMDDSDDDAAIPMADDMKYADMMDTFLKQSSLLPTHIYFIKMVLRLLATSSKQWRNIALGEETKKTIFDFLYHYKDVLHIDAAILRHLFCFGNAKDKDNTEDKNDVTEEDEIRRGQDDDYAKEDPHHVVCYPSLDDLLQDHVYCLALDDQIYYVPLWHQEVIFALCKDNTTDSETKDDDENKELRVSCFPVLPVNIEMDDDNHIYVRVRWTASEVWDCATKTIDITPSKKMDVPLASLRMVSEVQTIELAGMGVLSIDPAEPLSPLSKRQSIFVCISLTI